MKTVKQLKEELRLSEDAEEKKEVIRLEVEQKNISDLLADYELEGAIPVSVDTHTDLIPFKNYWGYWVWHNKDGHICTDPPGIKPPSESVIPKVINGKWYWVNGGRVICLIH